jgi:CBS domain-containing protein
MKINHILKQKGGAVYSISPENTMRDALDQMMEHTIGSLMVLDGTGVLKGIVSERDMLRTVSSSGADWAGVVVGSVMTSTVISVAPTDSVDYAMDLMTKNRIRHLPVVEGDGKLAGVLSIGDIIKANLNETKFQNEMLKNFIKNWPETG